MFLGPGFQRSDIPFVMCEHAQGKRIEKSLFEATGQSADAERHYRADGTSGVVASETAS